VGNIADSWWGYVIEDVGEDGGYIPVLPIDIDLMSFCELRLELG
jgi:hypothetical protein